MTPTFDSNHMTASSTRRSVRALSRRGPQGGFSLIVALMMLIVIIILGVGASQMAINEERGARGDRDKQIAFQAAEAALKDAEFEILYSPTPCGVSGETGRGRAVGPSTCFNETNSFGYSANCSGPPNPGLCDYNSITPVWVDSSSAHIDFLRDAQAGRRHEPFATAT